MLHFTNFPIRKPIITDVFLELAAPNNEVRSMPKKLCFTGPFDRQHGKWDETLLQSEREHLYQIYWSLWRKLRWKKSLLVIYKILRRFVSTLTADDKQYLLNRDNLMNPIQMQLSQKQKTFFQFFFSIFESYIKF